MSTPIRIRSVTPGLLVPAENVYFTFASGRLGYDCVTCGAKCCRGYGYISAVGEELELQLRKRPTLKFFVRMSEQVGGLAKVGNCAPGCFFLTAGGHCGIQAEAGYAAKPETCRLFPFNNLMLLGDYLVVAPHVALCPLRCVPQRQRDERSDHQSLMTVMSAQGISGPVTRLDCDRDTAHRLVALERRILDLTEVHAGVPFDELLAMQLVATGEVALDAATTAVSRQWQLCSTILGVAEPIQPHDPALNHLMAALTPYLRSRFLFPDGSDVIRSSAPPIQQATGYLAALYHLAALAKQSGMTTVTFQTITQLAESFRGPLQLLAFASSVVLWAPNAAPCLKSRTEGFQIPAIRLAKHLLHSAHARDPRSTLGEALVDNNPFEGIQRIEFLRFLAAGLLGKVEAVDAPQGPPARRAESAKRRLQRWGVQFCDESVLAVVWRQT